MTAIAGVVKGSKVWIGGDSAGVEGSWNLRLRSDEKVFSVGPFVMGFTSSFRMGQLLRYSLTVPEQDPRMDDSKFMVTTFIDAVRTCLKTGGYARKEKDAEEGGQFLVGYKGKLYDIQYDYQVGIPAGDFAAVGCGAELALGALHATPDAEPEERIKTALAAAERFSAGVRGPFKIVSSE